MMKLALLNKTPDIYLNLLIIMDLFLLLTQQLNGMENFGDNIKI